MFSFHPFLYVHSLPAVSVMWLSRLFTLNTFPHFRSECCLYVKTAKVNSNWTIRFRSGYVFFILMVTEAGTLFCRNPDGDVQPWCYIPDNEDGVYWKYCDIPTCQSKTAAPYSSARSHRALTSILWACRPAKPIFIATLIFPLALNSFTSCDACTQLLSSKKCL